MRGGNNRDASGSGAKVISGGERRRIGSLEKGYMAYVMVAPFILVFCFFSLYAVLQTIWLAFTDTALLARESGNFAGLDQFERLFKDRIFVKSIGNTWKIWIVNFIPQIGMAMLLSVWFTSSFLKLKLKGLFRSLIFMPNLMMPATVGVMYQRLFQDRYAPANQFLLGINAVDSPIRFFDSPVFNQMMVAYIQWWMWYGHTVVILVAGMSSISVALYESAMIDGANGWRMFRSITRPSLRPILVYTLVTSLVGGMQMFEIPYMISNQGGPENAISTMYTVMLRKFDSGKKFIAAAAAVGVVILMMTSAASLVIFWLLRDRDAQAEKKARKLAEKEKKMRRKAVM